MEIKVSEKEMVGRGELILSLHRTIKSTVQYKQFATNVYNTRYTVTKLLF